MIDWGFTELVITTIMIVMVSQYNLISVLELLFMLLLNHNMMIMILLYCNATSVVVMFYLSIL